MPQPTPQTLTPSPDTQPRQPLPEETANFFSRLFFFWFFPLLRRGYKTPLQDEHLWELRSHERGSATSALLADYWIQNKQLPSPESTNKHRKRPLEAAIFSAFAPSLQLTAALRFLDVILFVIQPVFVNRLIDFLQDEKQPQRNGYLWAIGLLIVPFLKTVLDSKYFSSTMRTGMRVRSALQGLLYSKSLTLSPSARASASLGEIVNLMQLDSQRIGDSAQLVHTLWSAPLQIIISVGLLYNYIGVSAFIGFILTFLTIPVQGTLFAKQIKLRIQILKITDKRVKLMNEILQGIKAVKFYAWENPFSRLVAEHRQEEVKKLRTSVWVTSGLVTVLFTIPIFIALVTFAFYAGVFKKELDPAKIFTSIALLNQLRIPIMMLPMVFTSAVNARLGIKRIERLLDLEDIDSYARDHSTTPKLKHITDDEGSHEASSSDSSQYHRVAISIKDGEFEWSKTAENPFKFDKKKKKEGPLSSCLPGKKNKDAQKSAEDKQGSKSDTTEASSTKAASDETSNEKPEGNIEISKPTSHNGSVLRDINIEFSAGKLHAVVGHVGSGKSSLFHAILGEMRKVKGEVNLEGTVAYVAQTAWIFHDTLKNNITFGKELDDELYQTAIEVSGLEQDISILPDGDQTSIGERGVNLSGGQKQRVSIARAVYSQADAYLFDDPLSALDAQVSQHVFDNCISNSGVLRDKLRILITNQVHVLPDCDKILFLDSGLIRGQGHYDVLRESDEAFNSLVSEQEKALEHKKDEKTSGPSKEEEAHALGKQRDIARHNDFEKKATKVIQPKVGVSIMQDEERQTGKVNFRVYLDYFRSLGHPLMFLSMMTTFVLSTAISFVTQWWLTYWSRETTETEDPRSTGFFLGIYFAISMVFAISTYLRSAWLLTLTVNAAKALHNSMVETVMHAPLTFFDTTPIGRILSRFSRDVSALDEKLPEFLHQTINTLISLVLTYVFIGYILPPFFAAAVPVLFVYVGIMHYFKKTLLELKRLDNMSKSPIYAHFSETLGGLSTLRAYKKQESFLKANNEKVDLNQRAYFLWIICTRLFTLCLESASCLLIFATAMFGVATRGQKFAGSVGLALTYALQVSSFLGFAVRSVTELEGQMNSVERANFYIKKLPQEAESEIEGATPEGWPGKGEIEFKDVELRYRDELPLVLNGVNVKVGSGEKVGVVGRTGSGKSSMMIALLRMVEPCGGQILVDGVDLQTLGLDDVRSRITIIPQDPVMFSGTIRLNLDPFGQFDDAELWDALEKSHLKHFVSSFEEGLDAPVSEYGENLSAGQRQIICLTRALLRKSKILILDEASSSLDLETDELIQETIRKHLSDATILTIAHRLLTLADYDRIVVLDNGKVAQVGTPEELLNEENDHFSNLVESMGHSGAAHFRRKVSTTVDRSSLHH